MAAWLAEPRRRWSGEVTGLQLPWYAEIKREEGAFATFLGLDLRPAGAGRPGAWQAVAVGDTCLVRVRRGRHVQAFPVARAADFGNQPALLASRADRPAQPRQCGGSFLRGDRLFLMTDALAHWFLADWERGGRPWNALAPLLSAARPEDAFAAWVEESRSAGALRDDDVTLLSIDFAPLPRE